MKKKPKKYWARTGYKTKKLYLQFAYGFSPLPDNYYAEIAPTKSRAIKQWGKDNIIAVKILPYD